MSRAAPNLVVADPSGRILDLPDLEAVGSSAGRWSRPAPEDWTPLPAGSELFHLPGRSPVGFHRRSRRLETLTDSPYGRLSAVAAFVAPAHTQLYSAAYRTGTGAPVLPLFAYTAVGWSDEGFVATAIRVDPDPRQDIDRFDSEELRRRAEERMHASPGNRLIQHLGGCALSSGCPAAKNLFLERWEAPLPTSPSCNASCLGCISLQENSPVCATQDRIRFVPTPEEICGVAVPHLQRAPRAVVSFGQGCEGEPLLQTPTILEAVREMRRTTSRGTINMNTNGSLPDCVKRLAQAGLDSIRVSLSSSRPRYYERYYSPRGYRFEDLEESIRGIKAAGGFASLNYFVLPGFTDEAEEMEALAAFIQETGVDLIQMRNLNIDPEWYLAHIRHQPQGRPLGIRGLIERLGERFPRLRFGYYNPCLDPEA
ncbi:MAG: radical SAM protein [Spirochaetales bacterium]|nr:radical SAM protein [Spirochaetales bacterium]